MQPEIHWPAIVLRLVLTLLAGGLLGVERSKTGHAAGLRTTLLVTLAASVAMIQMNLLMQTNGKPADSYAVMDLMRLPLGILTGVGFIGAGAIVRHNELVLGITTAATMWFATVVGLCLGGGQLVLGSIAALIGFGILCGLRWMESKVEQSRMGELRLTLSHSPQPATLAAEDLRKRLQAASFEIKSFSVNHSVPDRLCRIACELRWPSGNDRQSIPPIVAELEQSPGIVEIEWKGIWSGSH